MLFIKSEQGDLTVSFEEGMDCLDLKHGGEDVCTEAEFRKEDRCVHQLRKSALNNFAFFHFEYTDENGEVIILPGQLLAGKEYTWSENGVEPLLVKLMNSISLCKKTTASDTPSISDEEKGTTSIVSKLKNFIF